MIWYGGTDSFTAVRFKRRSIVKVRSRILLLASLLLLVSVGGIGNLMWQLPRIEQMQDLKAVLHCLILLGLFGAGLIFSVLELVRHEIMSPIFQLAAQVAWLKERKIDGHRLELTGNRDIDLLTRTLNDLLDGFEKEENLYRIFAEASPDMIFLLDRDGRVLFGNLNAARQWNYQAEEIIGKRQEELFPPDIAKRHKQVIQKVFNSGQPVCLDVYETIGQRQGWIDARMIPVLNRDGRVTAVLGISCDITERKKTEEKATMLSDAIENAHHGCLIISEDYKVVFANNYALTKLGFNSDELKNFDLFSLCADREQVKDIIETMKVTKRWMGEIAIIKKDGQQIPALVSITALGADGDTSGRAGNVILFQDISIQKEMREKLLTSEKLAVMGRLTADVAHELNNPLAIVIGGTQLMLSWIDEKAQTTFKSQLETVLRNARRCKTILGNLLGYGRTIGKKEEAVNLPDLIREATDDVNYQYDMSTIETVLNYNEIANAEITGNRSALLSVFVNLIRNARQAMGEKGRLTITIEKEDEKHLRIEIHDTGSGISKEQKVKLFKPFTSGWKEGESSGLGLATSLGIVATHGGSMSAASEGEGKGAAFTIILPCEMKKKK